MIVISRRGDDESVEELIKDIDKDFGNAVKGYVVQRDSVFGLNQDLYYQDEIGEFFADYGDFERSCVLLLRPDGYIGFRCLLSEKKHLLNYLSSFLVEGNLAA